MPTRRNLGHAAISALRPEVESKMKSRLWFVSVVLILLAFLTSGYRTRLVDTVTAGFIQVNTTDDEINNDGDCSLREAVLAANGDAPVDGCPAGQGADTILIPPGIYTLTLSGNGEDERTGDLDLKASMNILGAGVEATILDGNGADRVIHIHPGVSVEISNLTIRNGNVADNSDDGGGGVLNQGGQLTLDRCKIEGNQAHKTGGGLDKHGGGLDNSGTAIISECTFEANSADTGGAISNDGTLSISGSLLYNNSATTSGGALDNYATASITNTTISNNQGEHGGGIFSDGTLNLVSVTIFNNSTGIENAGTLEIKNSIVANSTAGDNCSGSKSITSNGHNLDSGSSCGFNQSTDKTEVGNVGLAPLGDNGGPTRTHALLSGSPAIDAGDNAGCLSTDQRGFFRPADGNQDGNSLCDIGAYEYNAAPPTSLLYLPLITR